MGFTSTKYSKWWWWECVFVVLDTFLSCKSLALQLKNTRSDGGVISKWRRWECVFVVLDTFCNSKSWALLLQNTRSDGRVKIEFNRFYSSRYNFIFQKIAFLKYKITRSGGGVISKWRMSHIISLVLASFFCCPFLFF